ncbi:hypothetical protein K0M31_020148 [Melipona bicolor]|uniref:Uncharacterized protein n=1 Tax=Melipona bicolor TaxID=60889 RepID=A0AA40KQH5_9HYME|nr:hypothetical protein K0M31_020148 [Melipona bicolor]
MQEPVSDVRQRPWQTGILPTGNRAKRCSNNPSNGIAKCNTTYHLKAIDASCSIIKSDMHK